jgi:hypothetical protein
MPGWLFYEATVKHLIACKQAFNRWVLKGSGKVSFKKGNLVQIYWSDLDYTFKMERKLVPKWSQPYRVRKKIQNAYMLEQLDRTTVEGEFSMRRLHTFILRRGSQLERDQKEWEVQHKDDQDEEESEEQLREDMAQTLLFMEGEHGVGDIDPGGERETRHHMPVQ